jgi:hypothetical protein
MFNFNLSSYLEKFNNLKNPRENKTIISDILRSIAGIEMKEEYISIQKNKVFLQGSSLLKNRVFMMKEEILGEIQKQITDLKIEDIV